MAASTASDVHVPCEEIWSHTNFKVAKFSLTWTISNFSCVEARVGGYLKSGTFPLMCHEEKTSEWLLEVYPKGATEESKGFVSIYLCCLPTKQSKIKVRRYEIGVIDAKGERSAVQSYTQIWHIDKKDGCGRGWPKFVKQNYLLNKKNGLMQDDKLVVFCDVEVCTDISNKSETVNEIQFTENYHLLESIEHLFETKQFSDVTLTACGKEFEAHKIILAAQSPVFAAMFTHDMEEKKQSRIDITDMDDELVKEMLCFLYTGRVKNRQKITPGLLAAAEKYALGRMKNMCEETLRTSLTIENAANTLILADLHRADQLKSQVLKFICSHATEVVTTADFKSMLLSHPNLIAEAFCELAQKTNGNSSKRSDTDAPPSKLRRTH